jgi:hypothetical protein
LGGSVRLKDRPFSGKVNRARTLRFRRPRDERRPELFVEHLFLVMVFQCPLWCRFVVRLMVPD